jgi:two-component system response regulator
MIEPIEILLIEDNPGDVHLTQEVFSKFKMHNNLHVGNDGVEALKLLHRDKQYIDIPLPDFILPDLNLPKKDGREVIEEINKGDEID